MRPRYVARRPRADLAADLDIVHHEPPRSVDIHERVEGPTPTGLLDQHGVPLYRLPAPRQIGFRPL